MPVVEGTLTATSSQTDKADRVEAAMAQAVVDCNALGITDPAEINRRILEARDAALAAG